MTPLCERTSSTLASSRSGSGVSARKLRNQMRPLKLKGRLRGQVNKTWDDVGDQKGQAEAIGPRQANPKLEARRILNGLNSHASRQQAARYLKLWYAD